MTPDYPNLYWSTSYDSQKQDEKFTLLREIVDAMLDQDMIRLLYEVFVTRCQAPLGNVVHAPTFMKQAEKLCSCLALASPEAQVMALASTVSMETLACHLLAVRMFLYRPPSVC